MKICLGCLEQYDDQYEICPHCGYEENTPPALGIYMVPGIVLHKRYVIGRALGHGGFSVTYIAWDALLQAKVAIKEFLPSEYATRYPGQSRITVFDGEGQQFFQYGKRKFLDEANRLVKFNSEEGIVHIFDCFDENDTAYLVMEYLDGEPLSEYLKRNGMMEPDEAIQLLASIAASLQRVHDGGMIHRDIAPDNIMLLKNGGVRLIDFGAARHAVADRTKSMTVIIKDGYSPVEQYSSHQLQGPATDIYALAATLYRMVTGVVPPNAMERRAITENRNKDPLKKPSQYNKSITHTQETAILNAMSLQAENRTQTVDAFMQELTAETPAERIVEKTKKNPMLGWPLWLKITAAAITVLLLAAVILYFCTDWFRIPENVVFFDQSNTITPNLINLQVESAEKNAENADLQLQIAGSDYDEGIMRGYILSQNPTVGTEVPKYSVLNAVASLGKERSRRPLEDHTDLLEQAAKDKLTDIGIPEKNIRVKYVESDENAEGTVMEQGVPSGEYAELSSELVLTVSKGRSDNSINSEATFTVGNYFGKNYSYVKEELLKSDVYLAKSATEYHDSIPYGCIIDQYPATGQKVHLGDAVFVVVSLGTEKTPIPDVLYKPRSEATRMLAECGLGWSIRYGVNQQVALEHVISQYPASQAVTNFGAVIALEISAEYTGIEEWVVPPTIKLPERITIGANEKKILSASVTSASPADIVWASSRPSVVKVDNGTIVGLKRGNSTITAAVDGVVATCFITVTDGSRFSVLKELTMDIGDQILLSSGIDKSIWDHVYWTSSKSAVATVDGDGRVTAVNSGNAVITAIYGDKVVKCAIKVIDPDRYAKIQRFNNTTISSAKHILSRSGVTYTVEQVYKEATAAGYVCDFKYYGFSDADYYYVDKTRTVVLYESMGAATITSILVQKNPTKTTYYTGESFNSAGLTLTAVYSDGSRKTVTSGFTASADLSRAGTAVVTIAYGGKSTTLRVTVQSRTVEVTSVTITPTSVSIKVGATTTLSAAVSPSNATNKALTWTSNNTSVATVDSAGRVTAQSAGTATITARVSNGRYAVCTVTVKENVPIVVTPSPITVTSIRLSQSSCSLNIGDSTTLIAAISPSDATNKTVTWTSSNTSVATVDSAGRVTAQSAGTATITARASNGQAATCTVVVSKAEVRVESISIPKEISLKLGESLLLKPQITPSNANGVVYTWTSSSTHVATVDQNGRVTANNAGYAVITVTTANGKSASCTVSVSGKASLKITTYPTQTKYYVGDTVYATGIVLLYTDEYGNESVVHKGYIVSARTNTVGAEVVLVQYKGIAATYNITVLEPKVTVTKTQNGNQLILSAITEPANVPVVWSSTDQSIFYISNGKIVPVSSGTAYACATMNYNGIQYTGYCPITIMIGEDPEPDYVFEIRAGSLEEWHQTYRIETNIPNIDYYGVQWSVNIEANTSWEGNSFRVYSLIGTSYTVTATYEYNGKTYTATIGSSGWN